MYEWQQAIQIIVNEIDRNLQDHNEEALSLRALAKQLGYSEFHMTRKFKEISGMRFRDYVRLRRLAFALKDVRDSDNTLLQIAIAYGYSTHEAFTRAFQNAYGMTPSAYRKAPAPLVLRTKIVPFDRYVLGLEEIGLTQTSHDIATYFVSIPAHKFLYINHLESNGYWDFWQKVTSSKGQDQDTICGLLDSIKGNLDDHGGTEANCGSGQLMAYIADPNGRLCDWGFLRSECFGIRLPMTYCAEIPEGFLLSEVPEADYLVFEHGPFDYDQENRSVEHMIEQAMAEFDFTGTGYCYDTTAGRVLYFYFDPQRVWKYVRPIRNL